MLHLSQSYLNRSEEISQDTAHIPGLYHTGDAWMNPDWDFFARSLTEELGNMGVLQAFLWKNQFLYEFGYKLLSPLKIEEKVQTNYRKMFREYLPKRLVFTGNFSRNSREYATYSSVHSPGRGNLVLLLVMEKSEKYNLSAWKNITEILESLGYALDGEEKRLIPLFSEFSENFLKKIREKMEIHPLGVLTHFYIQDMEKYFHALGMQKSFEILKTIQSILASHLKNNDIYVHQNPRSYFVYSPNCNQEIVLKRFEEVFIQVDHLIVDYRMRFLELEQSSRLEWEWNQFLLRTEN